MRLPTTWPAWIVRPWMVPAWIVRAWMVPACVTALAALPAASAVAQDQPPQYETPLYTTSPPAALDPNYGLPSFGMPGSDLPQQRTMGTPAKADPSAKPDASAKPNAADTEGAASGTASSTQDFFKGSTEIALPAPRTSPSTRPDSETPLYTTSQGSTTGEANATTGETPLFDDGSDQPARR